MSLAVLRADARCLPLPDASVDLIVTSPPYFGLRSYTDGGEHYGGQIGSEATPQEWLAALVECTAEWVRVLKPSGNLFVNLGDKYAAGHGGSSTEGNGVNLTVRRDRPAAEHWAGAGSHPSNSRSVIVPGTRPKSLLGLPWRYAIAATDQLGLILRRDIIWSKPNGLPESVTDRCRSSHEYVFHLVKQPRYYAAVDEIRTPHAQSTMTRGGGRNGLRIRQQPNPSGTPADGRRDWEGGLNALGSLPGSVWDISSQPLAVPARLGIDHFAAFPMELPRRIILGWSPPGVCTACGEGRRPVVEGPTSGHDNSPLSRTLRVNGGMGGTAFNRMKALGGGDRITGYACACPEPTAPTRPALVLDPFGGTGTTALVAAMHGRTGISIDMSADYSRLAAWRTADPAQRAAAMGVPKPPPVPDGMEALFT